MPLECHDQLRVSRHTAHGLGGTMFERALFAGSAVVGPLGPGRLVGAEKDDLSSARRR